jgi:hypothetical protein
MVVVHSHQEYFACEPGSIEGTSKTGVFFFGPNALRLSVEGKVVVCWKPSNSSFLALKLNWLLGEVLTA